MSKRGGPVSRILSDPKRGETAIHLRLRLPAGSSCQPEPRGQDSPYAVPIWHCSRWGLPCRSGCPSRGGLLPHRFTLGPEIRAGLFSVALSLGLPRPGVTRHRCLVESGLSSQGHPHAAVRPSARSRALGGRGWAVKWKTLGKIGHQDAIRGIKRAILPRAKPAAEGL